MARLTTHVRPWNVLLGLLCRILPGWDEHIHFGRPDGWKARLVLWAAWHAYEEARRREGVNG